MTDNELILDRYEPIGTAGSGGFGTVRIAWDPRIQRKVAIKTIRLTERDAYRAGLPGAQAVAAVAGDADSPFDEDASPHVAHADDAGTAVAVEAFTGLSHVPGLDEARTAAKLSDPRIVTVFDFEVRDLTAYLIMEYVEGITLTRLLADYADFLSIDMVTAVFDAVAGALSVAHDAGVLHLDIKPDNIIINMQGQAKVADFGLATLADASGAGTTGGGTIGYMPPEQIRREHLDARTDEWSLASVAYEMLTGDNPFRVSGLDAAVAAIENAELVLPSLCWDNLDEQVDDVLFYALDPDRDERYDSVSDFAEELEKFLGDPDKGREQLALAIGDALGVPFDDGSDEGDWGDAAVALAPQGSDRAGFLSWLRGWSASGDGGPRVAPVGDYAQRSGKSPGQGDDYPGYDDYDDFDDYDDYDDEDYDDAPVQGRSRGRDERGAGKPGPRMLKVAGRLFGALASAFAAFFAFSNIDAFAAFGPGAFAVTVVLAVATGTLAAIRTHIGALAVGLELGMAIISGGQPVVGAAIMAATLAWWYFVGRSGDATGNVALSCTLLGSVGGSSALPLLAGASLKPLQALFTSAYCAVVSFALGTLGSRTLLGWNAFANWDFGSADLTGNALALITQPAMWLTAAAWVVAALVLSAMRQSGRRWLSVVGLALGVVVLLVGTMVLAEPSPQLIVSVVVAAAVLITVELRFA